MFTDSCFFIFTVVCFALSIVAAIDEVSSWL
jgi:hypothetical protein